MVVTAPGKRPATFRTWKLSPAAPMVLQPMGCGRVGHRHNTPTEAARDLYSLWPLHCALNAISALPNAISALPNAFFADVALHGAGYPHEHHGLVQQCSKPDAHKPDAPQVWLAAPLGRQTNTGVRSTRLTTHKSHAIRMTELSAAPPRTLQSQRPHFKPLKHGLGNCMRHP